MQGTRVFRTSEIQHFLTTRFELGHFRRSMARLKALPKRSEMQHLLTARLDLGRLRRS